MTEAPQVGKEPVASSLPRALAELVAWVAVPWALAPHSVVLAILADVLLIGLPTVFATPGDKRGVVVAVPGWVTIALVVLQFVAALVGAWVAWPVWAAILVTVLVVVATVVEIPRWRRLSR
ncbi:hypothetical protein [Labedaea rhizosphaerae]|uniref:Uncharacterized protein n=1 Tax=Labedaea rhizosphaerae TaxID=598644 RepID=A0A4R6SHM1_LABRH|nr:hypothetical protein [Labedaea rhizosphaerae]TDQ01133.1 hypothetical protein EV186_1021000 [Labedaea rhizosphaerae]